MHHRTGPDRGRISATTGSARVGQALARGDDRAHAQVQAGQRGEQGLDHPDRQPGLLAQHREQAGQPMPEPSLAGHHRAQVRRGHTALAAVRTRRSR